MQTVPANIILELQPLYRSAPRQTVPGESSPGSSRDHGGPPQHPSSRRGGIPRRRRRPPHNEMPNPPPSCSPLAPNLPPQPEIVPRPVPPKLRPGSAPPIRSSPCQTRQPPPHRRRPSKRPRGTFNWRNLPEQPAPVLRRLFNNRPFPRRPPASPRPVAHDVRISNAPASVLPEQKPPLSASRRRLLRPRVPQPRPQRDGVVCRGCSPMPSGRWLVKNTIWPNRSSTRPVLTHRGMHVPWRCVRGCTNSAASGTKRFQHSIV